MLFKARSRPLRTSCSLCSDQVTLLMWKPTGRCVELHAVRDEQVPMGPARRFAINFNLTPELARCLPLLRLAILAVLQALSLPRLHVRHVATDQRRWPGTHE